MGIQRLQPVGGGTDWSKLSFMVLNYTSATSIAKNDFADEIIINGKGIVTQLSIYLDTDAYAPSIIIDGGAEKYLWFNDGASYFGFMPVSTGWFKVNPSASSINTGVINVNAPISFNSSFKVRLRNVSNASYSNRRVYRVLYHV